MQSHGGSWFGDQHIDPESEAPWPVVDVLMPSLADSNPNGIPTMKMHYTEHSTPAL